jgi:hypothetical protein
MAPAGPTPDDDTLREYLLGKLPPERAEAVTSWG